MENRAQKILHNLKSCLTHCSTISNITSDLNNPYLITSPRNFISGSKITSPIKINLTKRHQNLNNYFIESQFAKTNSLSKNILSPKNKSHRTLSHYNTQPNQSYSTNNIDNYTSNCLSTTSRTEMRRNSNKESIKLLNNFDINYAIKSELNNDQKSKYLMKSISEMTKNFKDENPFKDIKRYNIFLRNMVGDNSKINYLFNNNRNKGNISKNKVFSETNKIFFNHLMTDFTKTKNNTNKSKILSLKIFNNISKEKITNLKNKKICFIKNKSKSIFLSNKNLYSINKGNFHKIRSFSYNKISINLNDLF